ncbi:MAG: hypothetical protein LBL16_05260 [Endomicrobium sp.]|jgi:hypothetical protein|nr:hypothetical protein [Endomicrobium sp.]
MGYIREVFSNNRYYNAGYREYLLRERHLSKEALALISTLLPKGGDPLYPVIERLIADFRDAAETEEIGDAGQRDQWEFAKMPPLPPPENIDIKIKEIFTNNEKYSRKDRENFLKKYDLKKNHILMIIRLIPKDDPKNDPLYTIINKLKERDTRSPRAKPSKVRS